MEKSKAKSFINNGAIEQINGREGETATFLSRCLFTFCLRVGGFAPRHFNRSTSLVVENTA
jgi:hypothetical protein